MQTLYYKFIYDVFVVKLASRSKYPYEEKYNSQWSVF